MLVPDDVAVDDAAVAGYHEARLLEPEGLPPAGSSADTALLINTMYIYSRF